MNTPGLYFDSGEWSTAIAVAFVTATERVDRVDRRLMKIEGVRKKGVRIIISVPKTWKLKDKRELGRGKEYRSHQNLRE